MENPNPWDALSAYFDTSRAEVQSGSADNVLIAWPVILRFLAEHAPRRKPLRVLEYGCGGGGFAQELRSRGMQVVAVDSSPAMVDTARRAYGASVEFLVGDARTVGALGQFDAVTSVMVLQFVEDAQATIGHLAAALPPGGVLVFAVFNPTFVVERIAAGRSFHGFDSDTTPTRGLTQLAGHTRVPTFIRSAHHYNGLCRPHGLSPLLEAYPPFTAAFMARFPRATPAANAEYLILGYRKQAAPDVGS